MTVRHLRTSIWTLFILLLLALGLPTLRNATADIGNGHPGFEFLGPVVALPSGTDFIGDWTVGRRTVHVTATTVIDQSDAAVTIGALVEVEGAQRADGSVDATKIEVKLPPPPPPSGSPRPSPSPHPSPSPGSSPCT